MEFHEGNDGRVAAYGAEEERAGAATGSGRTPECESTSCGGIRTYSSHSSCPGEPVNEPHALVNSNHRRVLLLKLENFVQLWTMFNRKWKSFYLVVSPGQFAFVFSADHIEEIQMSDRQGRYQKENKKKKEGQ